MFCWHKYSKWETIKSGNIAEHDSDGKPYLTTGYYVTQQKSCIKCQKIKIRTCTN